MALMAKEYRHKGQAGNYKSQITKQVKKLVITHKKIHMKAW